MSVEQKLDLLTGKIDGLSTNVESLTSKVDVLSTKVDGLTTRIDGLETKVDGLTTRVDGLETKFDGLETRFDGLETEVTGLKVGLDRLSTKMSVGFEESHRLLKISLEGLEGLRESTDRRFDTMSDEHAKQFDLLTKFGVHVRRRVERLETAPPRRRR